MSNLVRGPQDYLLNVVNGSTVGMYVDSAGVKHLVIKKYGLDIPASTGTKAVLKSPQAGSKQKIDFVLNWLWSGEKEKVFHIEVTKQPLYTGFGHEQFPVSHTYSFKMNKFTTIEAGTLTDADTNTILNGLKAAILEDVPQYNAVNTGAVVVPTVTLQDKNVSDGSPDVVIGKLTLESKELGILFTVRTYDEEFAQTQVVPFQKATLTYANLIQIFGIRAENEGKYPYLPVEGTEYGCVTITMQTEGYSNDVPSAEGVGRQQVINLYMPKSAFTALEFATVTNAGTNSNSMADTVGTKTKSFKDYLVYLCGSGNVLN